MDTVVGNLTTSDDDVDQTHTYQLVDSAGGRFKISGSLVKVKFVSSYSTEKVVFDDLMICIQALPVNRGKPMSFWKAFIYLFNM